MLGQSQGRGYASTDARVPALNVRSSVLSCINPVRSAGVARDAEPSEGFSWKASIFDDCPMCGQQPVEPVRVEGQLVCRGCTSACTICGSACVPGDDACIECVRLFTVDRETVPV